MATREIVNIHDPLLRKKSRSIDEITPRIVTLLDDLRETLTLAGGVGLAAPQVGVLRRVAIIDTSDGSDDASEDGIIELINPEIISQDGEQTGVEGCLSLPGEYGIVTRPSKVRVRYTDRNGNLCEYDGEELMARAICHEVDHLDGIVYLDKAERMLTPEEAEEYMNSEENQ